MGSGWGDVGCGEMKESQDHTGNVGFLGLREVAETDSGLQGNCCVFLRYPTYHGSLTCEPVPALQPTSGFFAF